MCVRKHYSNENEFDQYFPSHIGQSCSQLLRKSSPYLTKLNAKPFPCALLEHQHSTLVTSRALERCMAEFHPRWIRTLDSAAERTTLTRSHHSRWEPTAASRTLGIQGGILQPEEDQATPPAEKQLYSLDPAELDGDTAGRRPRHPLETRCKYPIPRGGEGVTAPQVLRANIPQDSPPSFD